MKNYRTVKKVGLNLLTIFVLIFIIAGCASLSPQQNPGEPQSLQPRMDASFSDIPVPLNFNLQNQSSYSFQGAGMRVALLTYKGKADLQSVINFYTEQMPIHNWMLLNIVEHNQRLLNFEKQGETCIINLLASGRNITVTISLGPKSTPASKKPLK